MRIFSSGSPSSSAAICNKAVVIPCPSSTLPVATVTVPSRSKCTRWVSRRGPTVVSAMSGFQDGAHHAVVRPAAAEVLVERLAHFLLAGPPVRGEQRGRGNGDAAHAVAALRRLPVDERLLHGVQLAARAEALHGGDLPAFNVGNGQVARRRRAAVHQHVAGSAKADAATEPAA